jgi:hypothetical protein
MLDGWENDVFDGFDFLTFVNNTPADGSDDGVGVTADQQRAFLGRDASGAVTMMRDQGHGFPAGSPWYRIDMADDLGVEMPLRFLALNTAELLQLSDGGLSQEQLNWLQGELDQAEADQVLAVVMSHHQETDTPINGDALAAMLDASPNVILHLVGHGHDNLVTPHPSAVLGDGYGRWEIETTSTADFPQQSRILEIVDNRDGTGTIYATLFDHWTIAGDDADTLAALGRELAFADWLTKGWDGTGPFGGMGNVNDRNVALEFAIPDEIADKLADIPSDGVVTSTDVLGHLYEQ